MKGRLKEFALKLFALTLAIVMSIPTNVYAIGSTKSNKKQMPTSIRIADNSEYQDEYVEEKGCDLLFEIGLGVDLIFLG